MYIGKILKSGIRTAVIVRSLTEDRLQTRCFRGMERPLAGNFLRWNSVEGLFRDHEVMEHFLAELDELWTKREFDTHSVTIIHTMPVGWESTAPLANYTDQGLLEEFHPNRKSWGLRVNPGRTDLRAPKTNELTIVFEFKYEKDKAVAVVHSLYPGSDIGELDGDVTDREKRVFFDWNHPGEV